jgi:hypothetical protein
LKIFSLKSLPRTKSFQTFAFPFGKRMVDGGEIGAENSGGIWWFI